MTKSDAIKVMLELVFAVSVVAALCYARVDLGLSWDQINNRLQSWTSEIGNILLLIWLQIIVAVVCVVSHKIWKHRAEQKTELIK